MPDTIRPKVTGGSLKTVKIKVSKADEVCHITSPSKKRLTFHVFKLKKI